MRSLCFLLCCSCIATISPRALAQTQYRNLDAGRPGRIEDAESAARYSLDLDLAAFQVERLSGGTMRYRAEPKVTYGVLPFTELELRAPIVQITPPRSSSVTSVAGVAGLTIGMLHAFNLETTDVPALAFATEYSLPVGNLAPVRGSYLAKVLATKTTHAGRIHANAGFGTWTIGPASRPKSSCTVVTTGLIPYTVCDDGEPPIIIDVPCTVVPSVPGRLANVSARMCMPPPVDSSPAQTPTVGSRWFAGAGYDRSFPFRALLASGDLYAERLVGLYPSIDWTAELGLRAQLSPVLVASLGVGRHFAGVVRSTSFMIGASYEVATPPILGR